ncbi:MAG: hypothetical protein ACRDJF_04940 [Actinomycetota bacterium]
MADINITPLEGAAFRVEVREGPSSSIHEVSVSPQTLEQVGWSGAPDDLIRCSFEFLLEREPKESILRQFEVGLIARYFPEWEQAARAGFR